MGIRRHVSHTLLTIENFVGMTIYNYFLISSLSRIIT